jgi:hypothetical protein
MRVSIHEAVGGQWGASRGLYDPEPLALKEGDVIEGALTNGGKIELDEPLVVPRTGWYMVEIDASS